MTVYATDPLGASIRAFIWFLIFYTQEGEINKLEAPKSLEIREKSFLESLENISSRKNLEEDLVSKSRQKIKEWAQIRKAEFWDKLEKMELDEERKNKVMNQIKDEYYRILFDRKIIPHISSDDGSREFKKMDIIINVPKTLLVKNASQFTEFGIFGAGSSIGGSIAKSINRYIIDELKKQPANNILFNEIEM